MLITADKCVCMILSFGINLSCQKKKKKHSGQASFSIFKKLSANTEYWSPDKPLSGQYEPLIPCCNSLTGDFPSNDRPET